MLNTPLPEKLRSNFDKDHYSTTGPHSSRSSEFQHGYSCLNTDNLGWVTVAKHEILALVRKLEQTLEAHQIKTGVKVFNTSDMVDQLVPNLISRLKPVVQRTLQLELNVAKLSKSLQGNSKEEEFAAFLVKLDQDETFRQSLRHEYPALFTHIANTLLQWFDYCTELLQRLTDDHSTLSEAMAATDSTLGNLVQLQADSGDSHNQGRSVAILRFDSGHKLVYKPRPISADKLFQQWLAWVNLHSGFTSFETFNVVDRQSYGWCQYVSSKPLPKKQDARRYYRHFGQLAAIAHFAGATDLHFENVMAHGIHPVVVDLETLFTPLSFKSDSYSLLSTGLFPQLALASRDHRGIDMGAISALAGTTIAKLPHSDARPTATNRTSDSNQFRLAKAHNKPHFKGSNVDYCEYVDEITAGFKETSEFLAKYKTHILGLSITQSLLISRFRVLLRNTYFYHQVLSASYHPDLLRDQDAREAFIREQLQQEASDTDCEEVIEWETRSLLMGDIPIFHSYPTSRHLFSNDTLVKQQYFIRRSAVDCQWRLETLDGKAIYEQAQLLQRSLCQSARGAANLKRVKHLARWPRVEQDLASENALIAAASNIGKHLVTQAVLNVDDATWTRFTGQETNLTTENIDYNLHNGRLGPIVFLAYLGAQTGERRFTALSQQSLMGLATRIEQGLSFEHLGLCGWGGYIYALACLNQLWDIEAFKQAMSIALTNVAPRIAKDEHFDVEHGVAGCLLALLNMAKHGSFGQQALKLAQDCGEHLLKNSIAKHPVFGWPFHQTNGVLTGFSHGNAGIALALDRLFDATRETTYLSAAQAAITSENAQFDSQTQNWPDWRDNTPRFMTAWCHGAAGIGLSRCLTEHAIHPNQQAQDIHRAVAQIMALPLSEHGGLCHGNMGNLDILHTIATTTGKQDYINAFMHKKEQVCEHLTGQGLFNKADPFYQHPGMMTGLSGIGLALLKMHAPQQVPNVLALSPPIKSTQFESNAGLSNT